MAQLPQQFDATTVDPTQPLEAFPSGKYPMHVVDSEMKPTASGSGQYLQLVCEVIDGEFKGRKVWERLNLVNPNTTTVEIAYRTLSAICHAVGVKQVGDSRELHHKPFLATVRLVPATDRYDAKNEVKGYEPLEGAQPPDPSAGARRYAEASGGFAAGASRVHEPASPPWKRSAA